MTEATHGPITRLEYKGELGPFFFMVIKNFIFAVLTLGIYFFWGLNKERQYIWRHIKWNGLSFDYTGEGGQLFRGFIKAVIIYAVASLLIAITGWIPLIGQLVIAGVAVIAFAFAPVIIYAARNYRLRNTRINGYRLAMHKDLGGFIREFFIHGIITICTLGLYLPWFHNRIYKELVDRTLWGGQSFYYKGDVMDIIHYYVFGFLLAPITGGLSLFFFYGKIRQYRAQHTYFQGKTFRFEVSGWDFALIGFMYITVVPFTAFILEPVVRHFSVQYLVERVEFMGDVDWKQLSPIAGSDEALGEEFAGLFDLDFGFF